MVVKYARSVNAQSKMFLKLYFKMFCRQFPKVILLTLVSVVVKMSFFYEVFQTKIENIF